MHRKFSDISCTKKKRLSRPLFVSDRPALSRSGGFTLIELVVVMVLIGALSVVVIPRLSDTTFMEYGYSEELLSALRHARQTAVTRNTGISVAFATDGFRVCQADVCPASGGNYLTNPASGQPWDGSAAGRGKAPEGVGIATALALVTFDGLGRPSASGTLAVADHALTIEAETGYVH
ncbi:MAG: GspH/FimT family pseudopilin [Pseudomonadota bacterium]